MSIESYTAYLIHAYRDLEEVGELLTRVDASLRDVDMVSPIDVILQDLEQSRRITQTSMLTLRDRGEFYGQTTGKAVVFEGTETGGRVV